MSDQPWSHDNQATPMAWGVPSGPPSTQVGAPPPLPEEQPWVTSDAATSGVVRKGPGPRLLLVGALVGAAVLVAGAAWFAFQALSASDGAESPEAATDALMNALANEDFLTMAELLEPGERRAIAEPVLFEIVPELQRLGILSDGFDSSQTEGLEVDLADVSYRVDRPAESPDVALIYFTGGTSTTSFDVDQFQFGPRIRDEINQDPSLTDEFGQSETEDLASDTPLVMVERNGRWYVSMVYTAMEAALPGELPALVTGLPPVGAESPEAAVEAMLASMVDLDLRAMIQGLEPGEMHALQRYAPLFIDDAQRELDEFRSSLDEEGVAFTLSSLDLEERSDGDTTIVDVRGFVVDVEGPSFGDARIEYGRELLAIDVNSTDGTFDLDLDMTPNSLVVDGVIEGEAVRVNAVGSSDRTSWTLDAEVGDETLTGSLDTSDSECWPYTVDDGFETVEGCLLEELDQEGLNRDVLGLDDLPSEFPGLPVVVAENDGQWYVSPIGTVMHGVVESLRDLDEDDVDRWFDGEVSSGDFGLFGLGELEGAGTFDNSGGFDDFEAGPVADLEDMEFVDLTDGPVVIAGSVADNAYDEYVITATGQPILIEMVAGPGSVLDPYLVVLDEWGIEIASNDDDLSGELPALSSRIELYQPSGTRVVQARSLANIGGDYEIRISLN